MDGTPTSTWKTGEGELRTRMHVGQSVVGETGVTGSDPLIPLSVGTGVRQTGFVYFLLQFSIAGDNFVVYLNGNKNKTDIKESCIE